MILTTNADLLINILFTNMSLNASKNEYKLILHVIYCLLENTVVLLFEYLKCDKEKQKRIKTRKMRFRN